MPHLHEYLHPEDDPFLPDNVFTPRPCGPGTSEHYEHTYV